MADFVEGVAGDVLGGVAVEVLEGELVGIHLLAGIDFDGEVISDAAQFGVLDPEVGFDDLGCGEELEDGDISVREGAAFGVGGCAFAQQSCA